MASSVKSDAPCVQTCPSFPAGSCRADAINAASEHRLSFRDAMLRATAQKAGCAAILSEDLQHGCRFSGVAVLNPFAPDAAARVEALLERDNPE